MYNKHANMHAHNAVQGGVRVYKHAGGRERYIRRQGGVSVYKHSEGRERYIRRQKSADKQTYAHTNVHTI